MYHIHRSRYCRSAVQAQFITDWILLMIRLTRLNDTEILVNENFILLAEETPDTIMTMQNGHRFSVKETTAEIIRAAYDAGGSCAFVTITRLNGTVILLNTEFIEVAEEVPDTVVTMKNSHRYTIKESIAEILARADSYRKGIFITPEK